MAEVGEQRRVAVVGALDDPFSRVGSGCRWIWLRVLAKAAPVVSSRSATTGLPAEFNETLALSRLPGRTRIATVTTGSGNASYQTR
jgi:hypothetical protein